MSRTATVIRRQSVYDIAIEYCGSADQATVIAQLNDISPDDEVDAGTVLLVPEATQPVIFNEYKVNSIKPATGNVDALIQGGIGYMGISINFIVS